MNKPLNLERVSNTRVRAVRRFDAPPQRVWDAHWKPELLKRWMLGPPGWNMTVCEIEAKVDSPIRIEWTNGEGEILSLTGEVKELEPPHRSVNTEHFDVPGATPSVCETHFRADGNGTMLELTMTYESKDALDAAMGYGMEEGMEASYARLDDM